MLSLSKHREGVFQQPAQERARLEHPAHSLSVSFRKAHRQSLENGNDREAVTGLRSGADGCAKSWVTDRIAHLERLDGRKVGWAAQNFSSRITRQRPRLSIDQNTERNDWERRAAEGNADIARVALRLRRDGKPEAMELQAGDVVDEELRDVLSKG